MQPAPEQQPQQPQVMGQAQPMMQQGYAIPVGNMQAVAVPTTMALVALILSIVSIFTCGALMSIPSLIMANNALKVTNQYPGHPDASMAKIAKIVSIISIVLTALGVLFYGILFAVILSDPALSGV
jgi:type III secretory pathway component EscU